jgi:hypothetical protein
MRELRDSARLKLVIPLMADCGKRELPLSRDRNVEDSHNGNEILDSIPAIKKRRELFEIYEMILRQCRRHRQTILFGKFNYDDR